MDTRAKIFGWQAIGRIDMAGKGTCSGALIEPDIVLTAAHCVVDENGVRLRPERLMFQAGYYHGKSAATRQAKAVVHAPAYKYSDRPTADSILHDVALIQLEAPVPPSIAPPFPVFSGNLRSTDLVTVSYGRGRNEFPSLQGDCGLTDLPLGLYRFDCDMTYGSSGAPVFAMVNGSPRILTLASVANAQRSETDRAFAIGMVLPHHIETLKTALDQGQDLQQIAATNGAVARPVRIQMNSQKGTKKGLTSKFLRP